MKLNLSYEQCKNILSRLPEDYVEYTPEELQEFELNGTLEDINIFDSIDSWWEWYIEDPEMVYSILSKVESIQIKPSDYFLTIKEVILKNESNIILMDNLIIVLLNL